MVYFSYTCSCSFDVLKFSLLTIFRGLNLWKRKVFLLFCWLEAREKGWVWVSNYLIIWLLVYSCACKKCLDCMWNFASTHFLHYLTSTHANFVIFVQLGKHAKAVSSTSRSTNCVVQVKYKLKCLCSVFSQFHVDSFSLHIPMDLKKLKLPNDLWSVSGLGATFFCMSVARRGFTWN